MTPQIRQRVIQVSANSLLLPGLLLLR